jgi:hypothetical protein
VWYVGSSAAEGEDTAIRSEEHRTTKSLLNMGRSFIKYHYEFTRLY